jgi:hypothetical protein
MNEKTLEAYRPEMDPKMMRYWMRQGPKAAAFLLVIPGCTVIGYGAGLLANHSLPYSLIGLGAGLLIWGLTVSFGR